MYIDVCLIIKTSWNMADKIGRDGRNMPKPIRFFLGGLSGMMSSCIVHPSDVLKIRMQMQGEGTRVREFKTSAHLFVHYVRSGGIFSAYAGLSASLFRQANFATTRLGIYTTLFEKFSTTHKDGTVKPPSYLQKLFIAMTAGATGGCVATPAEVCLTRMALDDRLPPENRRNYQHVFHALYRVVKDEGLFAIYRGCRPFVMRAMVTNVSQLASYSQAKEFLLSTKYFDDNILTHFCTGMISGFLAASTSLPFDMAKTRIQNMRIIDGKPQYKGVADVIFRVVRKEGFFSLWKGFTPYYLLMGPHTVFTLLFLEQLTRFYAKHVLQNDNIRGL